MTTRYTKREEAFTYYYYYYDYYYYYYYYYYCYYWLLVQERLFVSVAPTLSPDILTHVASVAGTHST